MTLLSVVEAEVNALAGFLMRWDDRCVSRSFATSHCCRASQSGSDEVVGRTIHGY